MVHIFFRVMMAGFLICGIAAGLTSTSAFAQDMQEIMRKQREDAARRAAEEKRYQDNLLKQWQNDNNIPAPGDPNYQPSPFDNAVRQIEDDARRREQQRLADERAAQARFEADMARRKVENERRQRELYRNSNPYSGGSNSGKKPAGFGDGYAGGYKSTKPSGLSVNTSRASGANADWGSDIDDFSAKDERLKTAPTKKSTPIGCMCKGGDNLMYGVQCFTQSGLYYNSGNFPYTSACQRKATLWSHERQ